METKDEQIQRLQSELEDARTHQVLLVGVRAMFAERAALKLADENAELRRKLSEAETKFQRSIDEAFRSPESPRYRGFSA